MVYWIWKDIALLRRAYIMKKKLILALCASSMVVTMSACSSSDDEKATVPTITTTMVEENDTTTVEETTTAPKEEIVEPVENCEVSNNGGTVVKYGDQIVYWKYNSESYEKQAVLAAYSLIATTQNELVYENADGIKETILTTTGAGNLYILGDKLYFEKMLSLSEREINVISKVDGKWDRTTLATVCKGRILAVDEEREILIIEKIDGSNNVISSIDIKADKISEIYSEGSFLAYDDGKIFYQIPASNFTNGALGELGIGVVDLDGNNALLVTTMPNLYEFADGGEVDVQCMQVHNGYVYYSYGGYAGTANYYQGGNVCRVTLDGKNNEVLATDAAEQFYVYDENGKTKLIYADSYDDIRQISVHETDVESKTSSDSDMKLGKLQEPFYVSDWSYWLYKDTTGNCTSLITTSDFPQEADYITDVYNIELIDDIVYYTVVYSKYNEEVSVGWRDGYDWVKTEVYCKNLTSGEVKLIYNYPEN